MTRAALLGLILLAGCGYRIGGLHTVSSVRLGILDSHPERRTHEFDLTHAIARQLEVSGVRVNAPGAEHELLAEILDIEQRTAAVNDLDEPTVGTLSFHLRIRLVEMNSRSVVLQDNRVETADFTYLRNESLETARRELFDRLARWVAGRLEVHW
ncbi:MAG: hypothetical protein ACYTAF_05980 [Planctomycetota bacterium]|jgi:outer membrane lipopolysaccharide assembly protein LptE/RlpB